MLCFPLAEYPLTVLCATSILVQAKGRGYGTSEWSASDRLRPSLMGLASIFLSRHGLSRLFLNDRLQALQEICRALIAFQDLEPALNASGVIFARLRRQNQS